MGNGCKLTLGQLLQSLQLLQYTGQPAGTVGGSYNFASVVSPIVPSGNYLAVFQASVFVFGANDPQGAALYLCNGNSIAAPGNSLTYGQQPIFGSYAANGQPAPATICNGIPILNGLRVDESTSNDFQNTGTTSPVEIPLIGRSKRPLLVPQGFFLLGTNAVELPFGATGATLTLKLLAVQLPTTTSFDWP